MMKREMHSEIHFDKTKKTTDADADCVYRDCILVQHNTIFFHFSEHRTLFF